MSRQTMEMLKTLLHSSDTVGYQMQSILDTLEHNQHSGRSTLDELMDARRMISTWNRNPPSGQGVLGDIGGGGLRDSSLPSSPW